jgi:cysteine-rich repeat protein
MSVGETCDLGVENSNAGACTLMCKNAACGDGNVQMGVEECDDGNMVETDACINTCKAAKCGDGKVQANVEQCDDGNMIDNDACSNACKLTIAKTFSAQFNANQDGQGQCGNWNNFRASIANGGYTKVTLRGNLDMVGRVCNGANANTICQNLKNGLATNLFCDGSTWMIGTCGAGVEISTTGSICNCNVGHTVRPCIGQGNPNWGGMNTNTCNGPSQTLEVLCE